MDIDYNLLPSKFRGDQNDVNSATIWATKFRAAMNLKDVPNQDRIEIFKLWTEGQAAECQANTETQKDTKEWGVDDWLKELVKRFGSVDKINTGDIITLRKMRKEGTESLQTFNERFKDYLMTIPVKMYTEAWAKSAYLDCLVKGGKEKRDYTTVTCFKCGLKGHMASRCQNEDKKPDTSKKAMLAILEESEYISSSEESEWNSDDDEINIDSEYESLTEDSSQEIIPAFVSTNKRMRIDSLIEEHRELPHSRQESLSSYNTINALNITPEQPKLGRVVKNLPCKKSYGKQKAKSGKYSIKPRIKQKSWLPGSEDDVAQRILDSTAPIKTAESNQTKK
ncbi:hypothetical protein AYI69_g7083 [Smittium culicis]|uniref:CCHC-type domain-containing protein n=1 Tax=Smittium culicis TaxID=133412 RepID=A0A1R1XUM3_9FUNG|nr:hypothetical protein AYI69_g7083 [Smittium culicis]